MDLSYISVNQCNHKYRDAYSEYCYFKQVFDCADDFELVNCKEIGGGTNHNGVTVLTYQSAKGNKIMLDIDGGFPVPELATFELTGSTVNEDFIAELVKTFSQFHNTEFRHNITVFENGDTCRLNLHPNTEIEREGWESISANK